MVTTYVADYRTFYILLCFSGIAFILCPPEVVGLRILITILTISRPNTYKTRNNKIHWWIKFILKKKETYFEALKLWNVRSGFKLIVKVIKAIWTTVSSNVFIQVLFPFSAQLCGPWKRYLSENNSLNYCLGHDSLGFFLSSTIFPENNKNNENLPSWLFLTIHPEKCNYPTESLNNYRYFEITCKAK